MDYLDKTNEEERPMESELMDLGKISTKTKGSFIGHNFDGGWGVKPP